MAIEAHMREHGRLAFNVFTNVVTKVFWAPAPPTGIRMRIGCPALVRSLRSSQSNSMLSTTS
eukprot:scaffold310720_cov36-Tisochrysis_lutea.AAC.3